MDSGLVPSGETNLQEVPLDDYGGYPISRELWYYSFSFYSGSEADGSACPACTASTHGAVLKCRCVRLAEFARLEIGTLQELGFQALGAKSSSVELGA